MFYNYLTRLAPYAKAVAAFLALLIPFLVSLALVVNDLADKKLAADHLTMLGASWTALVGGTRAVYQVTNAPLQNR